MNRADQAARPTAAPKSLRLRERAVSLKGQAEGLLKKADALLAEAERLEAHEATKKPKREDFRQAAPRGSSGKLPKIKSTAPPLLSDASRNLRAMEQQTNTYHADFCI
jgi:hypothetical protein